MHAKMIKHVPCCFQRGEIGLELGTSQQRPAYLSNHFKVLLPAEINCFPIEKPLEFGIQRGITGHLTWQNQALSCGDVQAQRRNYNPGWFCNERKGEKTE